MTSETTTTTNTYLYMVVTCNGQLIVDAQLKEDMGFVAACKMCRAYNEAHADDGCEMHLRGEEIQTTATEYRI